MEATTDMQLRGLACIPFALRDVTKTAKNVGIKANYIVTKIYCFGLKITGFQCVTKLKFVKVVG